MTTNELPEQEGPRDLAAELIQSMKRGLPVWHHVRDDSSRQCRDFTVRGHQCRNYTRDYYRRYDGEVPAQGPGSTMRRCTHHAPRGSRVVRVVSK